MSTVRDDRAAGRFELAAEGVLAFAAYRRAGDRIVFTHTEVPAAAQGHGLGGRLIRGALDLARAEGATVVAECSFVRAFIASHPEYADLPDDR